jgi:hypothetical protein
MFHTTDRDSTTLHKCLTSQLTSAFEALQVSKKRRAKVAAGTVAVNQQQIPNLLVVMFINFLFFLLLLAQTSVGLVWLVRTTGSGSS